jgi:hypothetical protein
MTFPYTYVIYFDNFSYFKITFLGLECCSVVEHLQVGLIPSTARNNKKITFENILKQSSGITTNDSRRDKIYNNNGMGCTPGEKMP